MRDMVGSYLETLSRATRDAECTSAGGERMTLSAGSLLVSHLCHSAHDSGGKVMFIGNGGSMGIATHMAVDALSSSGASPNILNGVLAARSKGSRVVTFSGFREDNPLRQTGDINFYVRAQEYGFVELAHQSLLHAMLDVDRGWKPNSEVQRPRVLKRAEHG